MSKRKGGATAGSPETKKRKAAEGDARRQQRRRQRAVRVGAVVLAVLVAAGGLVWVLRARAERVYDLSVVGSGVPVVVQVHDITCPVCNELRENVSAIAGEFDPAELHLKIADVGTADGLAFAAEYTDQRRVTLLYFDGAGRLTDVQSGLRTIEELRRAFRAHIAENP